MHYDERTKHKWLEDLTHMSYIEKFITSGLFNVQKV